MKTLKEIIHPLSEEDFISRFWNAESLHQKSEGDRYYSILSWDEINRILEHHRLTPPRLRLEQSGKAEVDLECVRFRPARRGTDIPYIDNQRLYQHLRSGATLVLDSVDEFAPNVKELCAGLETAFHAHVEANSYLAWGESPGFGVHWDDHDLFVLQIAGRKKWQMYGQSREFPLYRDIDPNSEPPATLLWERVIEAGDLIYIPRGHWHGATGINEPTLHITIGVNVPSGIDFLTWLADCMRHKEVFRRDLPYVGSKRFQAKAHLERLKAELDNFWRDDLIETFIAERDAARPARPHISLPFGGVAHSIEDSAIVRYSGTSFVVEEGDDSDSFSIGALGRNWTFPVFAKALITDILHNESQTVSDLCIKHDLSTEEVRALCDSLLAAGFIYVAS